MMCFQQMTVADDSVLCPVQTYNNLLHTLLTIVHRILYDEKEGLRCKMSYM